MTVNASDSPTLLETQDVDRRGRAVLRGEQGWSGLVVRAVIPWQVQILEDVDFRRTRQTRRVVMPAGARLEGSILPRSIGKLELPLVLWSTSRPGRPLRPLVNFGYTYFFRLGFLDGRAGLLYCLLQLTYQIHIVVKAGESQQRNGHHRKG